MKNFLIRLLRTIARISRNGGAANGNTYARNAYGELERKEQRVNKTKRKARNKTSK